MLAPNTYKALIATTLLSTAVVFLGFTLQIKKKSELVAETFYDMEPEAFEEEKREELEEIIKSLDNLKSTNQAYNETKKYEEIEDKAFEERLEEIRNRNNTEDNLEAKNLESSSKSAIREDETDAFDNIKDVISKRTQTSSSNSENKNSSISYSLLNRTKIDIPPPIYLCENGGKVIINIKVNQNGKVTSATFNNASSTNNGCLVDHALEYAKASKFNRDGTKASQLGTITFVFKGKH